jgi:hypothetical protein
MRFALKSVYIGLTYQYDLLFSTSTLLTAGISGIFVKLLNLSFNAAKPQFKRATGRPPIKAMYL